MKGDQILCSIIYLTIWKKIFFDVLLTNVLVWTSWLGQSITARCLFNPIVLILSAFWWDVLWWSITLKMQAVTFPRMKQPLSSLWVENHCAATVYIVASFLVTKHKQAQKICIRINFLSTRDTRKRTFHAIFFGDVCSFSYVRCLLCAWKNINSRTQSGFKKYYFFLLYVTYNMLWLHINNCYAPNQGK